MEVLDLFEESKTVSIILSENSVSQDLGVCGSDMRSSAFPAEGIVMTIATVYALRVHSQSQWS